MDVITMKWIAVALCASTSAAILLVEHYWIPRPLHPALRYGMGMLAIYLPLTALFLWWACWWVLAAIWITTIVGGGAVILSYLVDEWHKRSARLMAAEMNGQTLREAIDARKEEGMD